MRWVSKRYMIDKEHTKKGHLDHSAIVKQLIDDCQLAKQPGKISMVLVVGADMVYGTLQSC